MKEVYAEVTRQCKLSHPAVDAEMMNNALQDVSVSVQKKCFRDVFNSNVE